MLQLSELRELAQWCHGHRVRWIPLAADEDRQAVILEDLERARGWRRVVLTLNEEGFSVLSERGETLANASDLTAVLDTLIDDPGSVNGQGRTRLRRRLMAPSLSFVL